MDAIIEAYWSTFKMGFSKYIVKVAKTRWRGTIFRPCTLRAFDSLSVHGLATSPTAPQLYPGKLKPNNVL